MPYSLIDHSPDTAMRNIFSSSSTVEKLLIEVENILIPAIQFPYPKELAAAMEAIIQTEGVTTTPEISMNASYSARHLNRLFNQALGMSIKSFSRLVRINKSIQLLNEPDNTLAFICEKLGYYDVSHFVKDFRLVCNIIPPGIQNQYVRFLQ